MKRQRMESAEDFWSRVNVGEPTQCWPWTKGLHKSGYGTCKFGGVYERCHRLAYKLTYGPIAEGKGVLHTCDYKPCCNPQHLYTGTDQDNVDDRVTRNRSNTRRFEEHGMAVLNWDKVREIRASTLTGAALARQYDVGETTIYHVRKGDTWREKL